MHLCLVTQINQAQNRNHLTGCIFIDYAKAFDCVSHNLLISKLIDGGIHHDNIDWFKNYFEDRTQAVRVVNIWQIAQNSQTASVLTRLRAAPTIRLDIPTCVLSL